MDNRTAIDVMDEGHQPLLEFVFRVDADMAQYQGLQFGEETFDDIEPTPVVGVKVKPKRPMGWVGVRRNAALDPPPTQPPAGRSYHRDAPVPPPRRLFWSLHKS